MFVCVCVCYFSALMIPSTTDPFNHTVPLRPSPSYTYVVGSWSAGGGSPSILLRVSRTSYPFRSLSLFHTHRRAHSLSELSVIESGSRKWTLPFLVAGILQKSHIRIVCIAQIGTCRTLQSHLHIGRLEPYDTQGTKALDYRGIE